MSNKQTWADLQSVFVNDDDKVMDLRQKQFEAIAQSNYPKIAKINLNKFNFDKLNVNFNQTEKLTSVTEELKQFIEDETNIIVIKDGSIIYRNLAECFEQVTIKSYFGALAEQDQSTIELLMADLKTVSANKLVALNKAYRNSGLLIEIPKNLVIKETLKVHIIASKDLVHKTMIIAGQNSEFTLLEKLDNTNAVNVSMISQAEILANAKFNYLGIDRLCETSNAFIERNANVNRDGSLVYALGQLNDGNTVSNNIVNLIGENAHCESRNVLFTDRESTHAITINIEHLAIHTIANIVNHGIVKDKGYLHIDGIGKIHQGMRQSNAQQSTHVITLSDEARVDANPYLLINEFDVFAGHGAGIGQVDEEQLYYMMSRGMKKREAEKLIILGFLFPIIEMIDSELIKADFIKVIERKLTI